LQCRPSLSKKRIAIARDGQKSSARGEVANGSVR